METLDRNGTRIEVGDWGMVYTAGKKIQAQVIFINRGEFKAIATNAIMLLMPWGMCSRFDENGEYDFINYTQRLQHSRYWVFGGYFTKYLDQNCDDLIVREL